jgi:hypothetical protein
MGDGTSRAKEASDITIIDNSFASINKAIMWGRSLYLNIRRFIIFQMTINLCACLIVLFGAFIGYDSPLTVTQMYLDVFLNFGGSLHRVGTLNTNNAPITIPANSTVAQSFDITVPWTNLGVATLKILSGFLTGGHANWPTEAVIDGQIKALGFTIKVNTTVPFSVGALSNQNQTAQ